jgi:deubiquitinating protein VCIP135
MSAADVIASTRAAVQDGRLFRCLICSALSMVPAEWLTKGGMLYQKAAESSSVKLVDALSLTFPFDGISAQYSATTDSLTPLEVSCFRCTSGTRRCSGDGGIVYKNGDRTQTVSDGSRCGCGYMHYWDGNEYDNLPER